jgi:hypothetical protein
VTDGERTRLTARLRALGQDDDEVLRFAAECADDHARAYDACARGDLRLWIAAAGGVPPRSLLEAALAVLDEALDPRPHEPGNAPARSDAGGTSPEELRRVAAFPEGLDVVRRWLAGEADGERCRSAADAAERSVARQGYREAAAPAAAHLASATAWLARGADAAHSAETRASVVRARDEAGRLTQWMGAQSFFDALLPAEAAAVENALADELAYAAAAAVMAVTEAARALVEAGSAASVEEALARADRVVAQRIPRRVLEEHLGREG